MSQNCDLTCCLKAERDAEKAFLTSLPPGPGRCGAKQDKMKASGGLDRWGSEQYMSYDACLAKCERMPFCGGFTYQMNPRRIECWLYYKIGDVVATGDKGKSF